MGAAVVLAAVAAAVVLTAAAERPVSASCGLSSGWGWAEMMDLHRHSKYFGDIWLLFGILYSVCVFFGIPKRDKYLAFYSCYK